MLFRKKKNNAPEAVEEQKEPTESLTIEKSAKAEKAPEETGQKPQTPKVEASPAAEKQEKEAAQQATAPQEKKADALAAPEAPAKNNGWAASQEEKDAVPPAESPLRRLWNEGYAYCYYIGTQLMRDFLLLRRDVERLWEKGRESIPHAFRHWRTRVGRTVNKACDDMLFPYRAIAAETKLLWYRLTAGRRTEDGMTRRQAFHTYFRATERPFNRIANFFAPIIGAAILAGVIGYFNSLTFAVRVDYNGEQLGYIASESEFYEARNTMLDRLINEEYIPPEDTIPTLSIAIVQKQDLLTQEQLADAIMQSSGNELIDANGFYLEGQFLGAVENGNEFLLYLDKILSNYRTGEEHEVVQFTKNIQLEDGVYPKSSLISIATLQDYLRSDQRLERTYSAKEGDTLAGIAKRYSTTVDELLDLNDELELYLTDLRIQYLGYDPDAPVAPDMVAEANAAVTAQTAAIDTDVTEEPAYDGAMEDPNAEPPEVIALEDLPLQGGEELLVARINVSLGIQVTRRETYVGTVAYGTTYVEDDTKPNDYRVVISAGIYGTEEVLADITYIDGVQVGETVLSRTRLTDPVNSRVRIGTLTISEWLGSTGSNFLWPVDGGKFNGSLGSYYGHTGMDIACPVGTTIRASKAGTVTVALNYGWNSGYGRTVVINHGGGVVTRYAHMSSVSVKVGQYVQQGQVIGYSGNTGNSSGPHCHFEIRINGVIMAPEKYIGYYSPR